MGTIGVFSAVRSQPIMRLVFLSSLLIGLACIRVFAGAKGDVSQVSELEIFTMGMGLLGGLALFLFGMEQLADALKARAGDSLKDVLARLTTNRITGALTGAFVTACVQSSSVTTVLVVGFITANIMSLSQSVGVIFGANIGSTVTAAQASDMIGVAHSHGSEAVLAGLVDPELKRRVHGDLSEPPVTVDDGGQHVFLEDLDLGIRNDVALVYRVEVLRDADESVRIVAGAIGIGQQPGHEPGIFR